MSWFSRLRPHKTDLDEDKFWQIVESEKGDPDRIQVLLLNLDRKAVDEWDRIYWEKHNNLHRWDVWGAAYVINGGCGDDSFHYFKAFAIAKGRTFYESLSTDPDSVGLLITDEDLDSGCDNESLNYVTSEIIEDLPNRCRESEPPDGEPWDEDELSRLFPRLTARFG